MHEPLALIKLAISCLGISLGQVFTDTLTEPYCILEVLQQLRMDESICALILESSIAWRQRICEILTKSYKYR